MQFTKINGQDFYNMIMNGCNKLEEQKEYVNSLNVFPVPDGDTGTNMSMTLKSAVKEIESMKSESIEEISKVLAKGALMGARGNSGVILSQILRGIAHGFEGMSEASAAEVANSIMEGSKSAYKAVMRPTEGTILTVVRAAGEAGINSTETDITLLLNEICEQSEIMLNKTPEMLPVLKSAKVVDAGGMGLLIILKGMYQALRDNIKGITFVDITQIKTVSKAPSAISDQYIEFGYCTEFFVYADDSLVNSFRNELEPHGDSMIVVGSENLIKVHIHTNDPGLVLSKALNLGELSKIKIENMREQHRNLLFDEDTVASYVEDEEPKEFAFISVAMGEGLSNIFKDLGADFVIEGGQTMNPSTQNILECIDNINAENIFIIPNNKNIIMAATQAADISNKNVIVIPTKTIPEGISCLTTFNPECSLEENIAEMKESINNVTTCSVTYAVRDTNMDGFDIKEGNILGLLAGEISEVGTDIYEVLELLIFKSVDEDSSLITLFYGEECIEDEVNAFVENLEDKYPDLDIQLYNGSQPLYYFIASIE